MTEKLKYKVGDKVLIEAEITDVLCDSAFPYMLDITDGTPLTYVNEKFFDKPSVRPLSKPKITQAVMEYYTQNISADYDYDEWFERSGMPDEIASWLYYDGDDDILMQRQHALATLITYGPEAVEVEKEKRYVVSLKSTRQVLFNTKDGFEFRNYHPDYKNVTDMTTRKELIDAGFEGVFDNPMFEVEEVE